MVLVLRITCSFFLQQLAFQGSFLCHFIYFPSVKGILEVSSSVRPFRQHSLHSNQCGLLDIFVSRTPLHINDLLNPIRAGSPMPKTLLLSNLRLILRDQLNQALCTIRNIITHHIVSISNNINVHVYGLRAIVFYIQIAMKQTLMYIKSICFLTKGLNI